MGSEQDGLSWDSHRHLVQRILNSHEIPPNRAQKSGWLHCRARVVYELDGEEWIDTVAYAWTSRLVLVQRPGHDYRWERIGVWLDASDVRRRAPKPGEQ